MGTRVPASARRTPRPDTWSRHPRVRRSLVTPNAARGTNTPSGRTIPDAVQAERRNGTALLRACRTKKRAIEVRSRRKWQLARGLRPRRTVVGGFERSWRPARCPAGVGRSRPSRIALVTSGGCSLRSAHPKPPRPSSRASASRCARHLTLTGPSRRRPRGNCRSLGLRARPRRLRARPDPRPPSHRSRPETAASGRAWLPCGGRPSLRGAQAGASAGPLDRSVRSPATRRVRLTRRGLIRAAAGAAALAVPPARSRAMTRALAEVGRDRRGCWRVRCLRYGNR